MNRRKAILLLVLIALLAAAALWSHGRMASARAAADRAADDAALCRNLADQIDACRRRPSMAVETETLEGETTGLIERAAKQALIDPTSLIRITPEPPRRLADTVYKEKPTQVTLENVTLLQVGVLMHTLACGQQKLTTSALRLAAPRAEDTGPHWKAELTLTYLIYDPPRIRE